MGKPTPFKRQHLFLALFMAALSGVLTVSVLLSLQSTGLKTSLRHAQWEIVRQNACGALSRVELTGLTAQLEIADGLLNDYDQLELTSYDGSQTLSLAAQPEAARPAPTFGTIDTVYWLQAAKPCADGLCLMELALFPSNQSPWLEGFLINAKAENDQELLLGDVTWPIPDLDGQPTSFSNINIVKNGAELSVTVVPTKKGQGYMQLTLEADDASDFSTFPLPTDAVGPLDLTLRPPETMQYLSIAHIALDDVRNRRLESRLIIADAEDPFFACDEEGNPAVLNQN